MTKIISNQESTAISYLRVLSMVSIVTCHFMQSLGNHWAWVFNIGVQVFLLMSGFLYGYKQIVNWREWFGKRLVRIYVPYVLFVVAVLPTYLVAGMMSIKNIFLYLSDIQGVVGGGVKGLGHLWFMTAIVLCYAITPLLQWSRKWGKWLVWLIVPLSVGVLLKMPSQRSMASWFILYALGYYLATLSKREKWAVGILASVVFILLLPQFEWAMLMQMGSAYSLAFHITGAVVIFLLGLLIVYRVHVESIPSYVLFLDKYSFQIYIVHHVIIMPPFGMLHITEYLVVNMLIALFYIAFFTWVLVSIEERVKEFLSCKLKYVK